MASAITSAVSRLGEMAVMEAALLRGVDDYIPLLRDKLEWMQVFIQQESGGLGEDGSSSCAYVDLWVRQTREVACQVEDVLDEFLAKAVPGAAGGWLARWLRYVAGCATHVFVRHDLKARMDVIKNRLREISDNANTYKVERLRSHARDTSATSASSATPYSSIVVPFAEWDEATILAVSLHEREDLEGHLLDGKTRRSIINIVGDSGSGKSTLAWEVYDSHVIRLKFDVRAWINIPKEIRDADAMLYFIYKRLLPDRIEDKVALSIAELHHESVCLYLHDKCYLIVIDCSSTQLYSLLHSLPYNDKGSRAVFITSVKSEERVYSDPMIHRLKISNLVQEDSARLFCRKVFGDNYQSCNKVFGSRSSESLMGKVEKDIFEITKGLPLAIVVLSGLLQKRSIRNWGKVMKQLKSNNESNSKQVERILTLSYGELPVDLKSCFLYLAGFPKKTNFSARRLVRLWAAEGFLRPGNNGQTMEDIGQNNPKELISRRMVNLVRKDLNGDVWLISIHDRIHDFAKSQAHEASFLLTHDNNVDTPVPASVRRLYLQHHMQSSIHTASLPMLWSISCHFPEDRLRNKASNRNDLRYHAFSFIGRCRFLRVIDLQGLQIRVVPHAIGDMVHLRYLGLSSQFLTELTSSVARLTKLETLDIKRTKVKKVAQAFWEIPTLRHVVAKELRFPKYSGVLKNLQTLIGLVCSDPRGININPLHNMVYLRYLDISGLTMMHWVTLADIFQKLDLLVFLRLAGDDIPFKIFTKFTLPLLQTLELTGRIDRKHVKTEDRCTLFNLTRLVLKLSMVDQMFIDKIGELPSLMEIVLSEGSYSGESLVFPESGFKNVTSLVMSNLTLEWTIRTECIPKIRKIVLSSCPKMKIKIDVEQGLEEGLMQELDEVLVGNMTRENLIIEPANSVFSDKINHMAKREYATDRERHGR